MSLKLKMINYTEDYYKKNLYKYNSQLISKDYDSIFDLSFLKQHLYIADDNTDFDNLLYSYFRASVDEAEGLMGKCIVPTELRITSNNFTGTVLTIYEGNFISGGTVKINGVDSEKYKIYHNTNEFSIFFDDILNDADVEYTFNCGFNVVEEGVKLSIYKMTANNFEVERMDYTKQSNLNNTKASRAGLFKYKNIY